MTQPRTPTARCRDRAAARGAPRPAPDRTAATGRRACRAGPSILEFVQEVVRQRRIEVLGHREPAAIEPAPRDPIVGRRPENSPRLAPTRDQDLLASRNVLQQP